MWCSGGTKNDDAMQIEFGTGIMQGLSAWRKTREMAHVLCFSNYGVRVK